MHFSSKDIIAFFNSRSISLASKIVLSRECVARKTHPAKVACWCIVCIQSAGLLEVIILHTSIH